MVSFDIITGLMEFASDVFGLAARFLYIFFKKVVIPSFLPEKLKIFHINNAINF